MELPRILIVNNDEKICAMIARALWDELQGRATYGQVEGGPAPESYSEFSVSFVWNTPIAGLKIPIYACHGDAEKRNGLLVFIQKVLDDFYHDRSWAELCTRLGTGRTLSQ